MKKTVTTKWETDGQLAVIYKVGNLLLFYKKSNDPNFKKDQELSMEEADSSKPYKACKFSSNNVPSDAYISLTFSWSK